MYVGYIARLPPLGQRKMWTPIPTGSETTSGTMAKDSNSTPSRFSLSRAYQRNKLDLYNNSVSLVWHSHAIPGSIPRPTRCQLPSELQLELTHPPPLGRVIHSVTHLHLGRSFFFSHLSSSAPHKGSPTYHDSWVRPLRKKADAVY